MRRQEREEARRLYAEGKTLTEISRLLGVGMSTLSRWKGEDREKYRIDWDGLRQEWQRSSEGARQKLLTLYNRVLERIDAEDVQPGDVDALHKLYLQIEKFEKTVSPEKLIRIMDEFTDFVAREEDREEVRGAIGELVGKFLREKLKK